MARSDALSKSKAVTSHGGSDERRNFSRRKGYQALSDNSADQQTVTPDIRQTDDLLSVINANAGGYSRNYDYFNSSRGPVVSLATRRRLTMGNSNLLC